jgi:hypothetical protein
MSYHYPPLHVECASDTSVLALLGSPPRLYPFGEAREAPVYPYVVWQTVYGQPENYLGQLPDADSFGTQIDVYAKTWSSARNVAAAVQAAIEPVAYVTAYHGEMKDIEAKSFRISFTVEWIVNR